MKAILLTTLVGATLVAGTLACTESMPDPIVLSSAASARTGTSTGQGILVDLDVAPVSINEEGTYTFDKEAAKGTYTIGGATGLVITTGTGAPQPTPTPPPADPIGNGVVESNKCVFFHGGTLPDYTYTKTINGTRGWKWRWTYAVTGATVAPKTAWTYQVTVPGVAPEVPINAVIAGLSALSSKQHPLKYSFSLLADDGLTSRIQDLKLTVDGIEYTPGQTLLSGTDFVYTTNAGSNGTTSLLEGTDGQLASQILRSDSFANNDTPASIVCARMDQVKPLLGVGTHTIRLTAVVKGNEASAETAISVEKIVVISGGCL